MEMVNGYVFLDLTKSNVYAKALKVLGADKPVVIKDGGGSPYFVDSMALVGTNVVITKGGKTITIANDNTITNVGDIQNHLYQYTIMFDGNYNDGAVETTFKLKFISNKSNITIDDLINNNDVISQYNNNFLCDYSNDGGANVYSVGTFQNDNELYILDTTYGENVWKYSNLVIAKIQLL